MTPKIAKLFKEIGELGSLLKVIPDDCAELFPLVTIAAPAAEFNLV